MPLEQEMKKKKALVLYMCIHFLSCVKKNCGCTYTCVHWVWRYEIDFSNDHSLFFYLDHIKAYLLNQTKISVICLFFSPAWTGDSSYLSFQAKIIDRIPMLIEHPQVFMFVQENLNILIHPFNSNKFYFYNMCEFFQLSKILCLIKAYTFLLSNIVSCMC